MRRDARTEGLRWLEQAQADRDGAWLLFEGGSYHLACFVAQQVTEPHKVTIQGACFSITPAAPVVRSHDIWCDSHEPQGLRLLGRTASTSITVRYGFVRIAAVNASTKAWCSADARPFCKSAKT